MASIFREAAWATVPEPSPERVERIEKRLLHEMVIKDSTDFVMISFSSVFPVLVGAVAGCAGMEDEDYRV